MSSKDARETLVRALRVDLIGPDDDIDDESLRRELLRARPARAYLTGFLVPAAAPARPAPGPRSAPPQRAEDQQELWALSDETSDEQLESSLDDGDGEADTTTAQRPRFPSSFGLSVLVQPEETRLHVRVTYGTYERTTLETAKAGDETAKAPDGGDAPEYTRWRRTPHDRTAAIDLIPDGKRRETPIDGTDGLVISAVTREVEGMERALLDDGIRAVTLFLVNRRDPTRAGGVDGATIFQARMHVSSSHGFVPRQDPRGTRADDPEDERVAELLYRDTYELAVGHGIAVMPAQRGHGPNVFADEVTTSWMPRAEVERTIAPHVENVELRMEALADLAADDVEPMRRSLLPIVPAYEAWIAAQEEQIRGALDDMRNDAAREIRKNTATALLGRAREAAQRIRRGVDLLCRDPLAFEAFRLANRAMAMQMWQQQGDRLRAENKVPEWRVFQLAFLLLALPGIVDPTSEEREIVDLIFFPTGGGKTEAYLGLAAITLILRRLRQPDATSGGVSVLMRYTLRLLTLDQLGRAATLMCALEILRRAAPDKLGPLRFSIGLWIGRSATPNRFGDEHTRDPSTAIGRVLAFKSGRGPMFFPLDRCPWCGSPFVQDTFEIKPNRAAPRHLRVLCFGPKCPFRWSREHPDGIPVVIVDEEIYTELPPFLIATVDKLAALPWVYRTAFLFGKHITHHHPDFGYDGGRELEDFPGATRLPVPLSPPDLVIQDELHLIAGPLGTMVGLYETAISHLSERVQDGHVVRPKIVASTATVRRAEAQIRAIFGRAEVRVFPPPGPDRTSSFFAAVRPRRDEPSRSYLGITAPGRSQKALLMRTYTSLLAASARIFRDAPEAADPYMTLVGYFNSLRELGGSRRIVEDEVRARLGRAGQDRRIEEEPLFADRRNIHVVEITSRLSTNEVRDAYAELRRVHEPKTEAAKRPREAKRAPRPVDVALATNMISVGLDVSRLGLMVVCGQPKTTAEYIQATSRVGRDPKRPGLVITLLNAYRARDRSHVEHFAAYHASFYRAVEATSVTPFAPRAVDRGLAALTVALARLGDTRLLAPDAAGKIAEVRPDLGFVADVLVARAEAHAEPAHALPDSVLQDLRARVEALLAAWVRIARNDPAAQGLAYQPYEPKHSRRYLLHMPVDPDLKNLDSDARRFVANRSLRDVEGVTDVHVVELPKAAPPAADQEQEP